MKSLPPKLARRRPALAGTDFHSLMRTPDHDLAEIDERAFDKATDFRSLVQQPGPTVRTPPRTATDFIVDAMTPVLIFVMCYTVVFFLLDVRFIYTEVNDKSFRWVSFFFLMGIVASNRLLAKDSTPEGYLLPAVFAGSMALYTLSMSTLYENSGSVARNFLNDAPWLATAFNMIVVVLIWWVVNRLTHECCIDENKTAGDVGILTGTARRFHEAMRPKETDPLAHLYETDEHATFASSQGKEFMPMNIIEAFDPTEGWKPKARAKPKFNPDASQRLSKRHPGISILYFSVPVMFIFTLGIRVVQQGGESFVQSGHLYAGIYTLAALQLLLLTSLGGLREYFRSRMIAMPGLMGYFWIGLGTIMTAMVMLAAAQLRKPDLPPMAIVEQHQTDYWSRGSTFQLASTTAKPMEMLAQSQFMDYLGKGVLALFGVFGLYGLLKLIASGAAWVARRRHRFPRFVVVFFDGLERFLSAITRMPSIPKLKWGTRIDRSIATSSQYENSLGKSPDGEAFTLDDHVAYAYEALGALAYDLGVPRGTGQTPYEFIDAFPKPLRKLKKDARELTRLYVQSAYSRQPLQPADEQALRKFWVTYNQTRRRVLR